MTRSLSRYSHLILAISTALFLFLASVSGIILAVEPLLKASKPFAVADLETVTLAQTLSALDQTYDEVLSLEVDSDSFVTVEGITTSGTFATHYINPQTGQRIGVPEESHAVFTFSRNLHRSLFLKSIGRFFVGLVSFLLLLIAITGFLLLIQRQGGMCRIFSRVEKDYFELRYHVLLSRWFFIPIVLIALTGVVLSVENFSLLPSTTIEHSNTEEEVLRANNFGTDDFFETTTLRSIRKVMFPFSGAEEDYYQIALKNSDVLVHQYTKTVVSEEPYPFVQVVSNLSYLLHTGEGNPLWSFVLLLSSCALLFFMYSGFRMTFRNRSQIAQPTTQYTTKTAQFIILFGSETGATYQWATYLLKSFIHAEQKAAIAELNDYTTYPNAKHLIILTATYGNGEAPSNARNFEHLLATVQPSDTLSYTVVGFGDRAYPNFCQFALKVDALLEQHPQFVASLPIHNISKVTEDQFKNWVNQWNEAVGTSLGVQLPEMEVKPLKRQKFKVISKSVVNEDNAFLVQFRVPRKSKIRSGDLLAIAPTNRDKERLYSIGRIGNQILLSIKKHPMGTCSTYLSKVEKGSRVEGRLQKNPKFNFPIAANKIVFISNGTGIAPFLGMMNENSKQIETHLFWGGRDTISLQPYQEFITVAQNNKQLTGFYPIFSRVSVQKSYVQDLIIQQSKLIADTLMQGGVVMICGSLKMQEGVVSVLEKIATSVLRKPLKTFESQLKMDCY